MSENSSNEGIDSPLRKPMKFLDQCEVKDVLIHKFP
jgi:hypothetical protein